MVALSDRGNYPVVSFENADGDAIDWFPSVVAERDGQLCFGFEALARSSEPGWSVVRSFKRLLGSGGLMSGRQLRVGESTFPVAEVLTGFLSALARAIRWSQPGLDPDEPLEAVVATPAHALGPQRFITLDAFRSAGFELLGFLDEPSAAGFEYTHRFRKTLNKNREHVLIYDLGGGTFDAALVHVNGLRHEIVTTGGDDEIGGDDFDTVLVDLVVEQLQLPISALDPLVAREMGTRAQRLKEGLHPSTRKILFDLGGLDLPREDVTISVSDYYDACLPLVEGTMEAMAPVLAAAESRPLAGLYVVGGGSALPVVGRRLKEDLGRRVHRSPHPSAAVAIGLAIAADEESGFELTGRLSRFFGVFRERDTGRDVAFDPIFGKDVAVGGHVEAPRICREYRAAHNVGHYRFVETSRLDSRGLPHERLQAMGELTFPFDPRLRAPEIDLSKVEVERLGEGPWVREEYTVSPLGLVEVALTDLETGFARRYTLSGG